MGRKQKHEEHVNHERWLVSYADFITLLFAFFVVMYALSEVDKNKLKKFQQSVQFAFSHVGTGGTMTQGREAQTYKPQIIGTAWPQGRRESDPGPYEALKGIVQFLENSILQWFQREERVKVEVIDDGRGILVRLPAERLFSQSSATLRPDRVPFLADVGRVVGMHHVSFRVLLGITLPRGGDAAAEHDLGSRRLAALVHAIVSERGESRAALGTQLDLVEQEDVAVSEAERSRSVFELRITP